MTRSLRSIIVCLSVLGMLVQGAFARVDVVLCLGHLHAGSCSVAVEEGMMHEEECCDHAEHEGQSVVAGHHSELPGCCCVDVAVSGQHSSMSKRMLLAPGLHKSLASPALIATLASPPLTVSTVRRVQSDDRATPQEGARLRAVILQI